MFVYNTNVAQFGLLSEDVIRKHLPAFTAWFKNSKDGESLIVLIDRLAYERLQIAQKQATGQHFGVRRFRWFLEKDAKNDQDPMTPQDINSLTTFFAGPYECVTKDLDQKAELFLNPCARSQEKRQQIYRSADGKMGVWRESSLPMAIIENIAQGLLDEHNTIRLDKHDTNQSGPRWYDNEDSSFELMQKEKTEEPNLYNLKRMLRPMRSIYEQTQAHEKKGLAPDHCDRFSFTYEFEPNQPEVLTQLFRFVVKDLNGNFVFFPFLALHQDRFLISTSLKTIEQILVEVANVAATQKENVHGMDEEIFKKIALVRYLLAHACPWFRGSAAIGEWLETLIFRALGVEKYPYQPISKVDLGAFALPLDEFVQCHSERMKKLADSCLSEQL